MAVGLLILGYPIYAAVKYAGYTLSARVFGAILDRRDVGVWRVGLIRTGLGIVIGAIYTAAWAGLAAHGVFQSLPLGEGRSGGLPYYLLGLVPVRTLEWRWLIWFCFDRRFEWPGRDALCVSLGVVWSFVLDLPVLTGAAMFLASIC